MNEYNPKEFFIQFRHQNKTTQCDEECLQCYPKPSLAFQTLPVDSYRQVFVETIEKNQSQINGIFLYGLMSIIGLLFPYQ